MKGSKPYDALITGGSGFLGSRLAEKLVENGHGVTVFDNNSRGNAKNLKGIENDIDFIEGDIRDINAVREAMKGRDVVFHMASLQGTKNFYLYPDLVLDVGLTGNLNVAKVASETKPRRVVFTSSSEIYAQPRVFPTPENHEAVIPDTKNPRWSYSLTKVAGEVIFNAYARRYGIDVVIVRPHNAYGPRMGWDHVVPEFIKRIVLDEKFTIQGSGLETRSFCFVDDMIDGIVLAAERKEASGEIFNLGNDKEEHSIMDIIGMLSKITGKNIEPEHLERPEGSTPRRLPDIGKARRLLGYEPKVSTREGLEITYHWYENEIKYCLKSGMRPWEKKL